jgi:hypothetical protein
VCLHLVDIDIVTVCVTFGNLSRTPFILGPQGRRPKMGTRSRWKTGVPHYIFAFNLLGSRVPEDKAPVGMYEHAAYTNRHPSNNINTVKYIKLNRKIYNNETKKYNGTTVYTQCKKQDKKEHSYSRTTLHNPVSRDVGKHMSHSQPIYLTIPWLYGRLRLTKFQHIVFYKLVVVTLTD